MYKTFKLYSYHKRKTVNKRVVQLGDKRTLFVWFERVYGGYTVGNEVFLATRQRSQENVCFQRYKHHIPVRTTQTVYVYLHSNSDWLYHERY